MPGTRSPLRASESVTLDATGSGTVRLGPQSAAGPANWLIRVAMIRTSRPGQAPVPRFELYKDEIDPANSLGFGYDGSLSQGSGDELITRGSVVICIWTGGQVGDRASLTVSGEKW